ncbi:MAG: response regulator transcription factor [Clostridia bacterium]|nr:response regulator transcription factor [Clostridia bacterium]
MFHILVVEDDRDLRDLFCDTLSDNGFDPIPASDGEDALRILENTYVDLIISDIMMPKMDGYALTEELRRSNIMTPVLMITARSELSDKQMGFRVGTDDYMVKPIDLGEMIWRVRALLRRSQMVNRRRAQIGNTEFDCDALTVRCGDTVMNLPQKEFFLLYKLVSAPGRIFTRVQIMEEIWGIECETDTHTIDVHINRLREKFKDNPDFKIVTIRGLGYKAVKL